MFAGHWEWLLIGALIVVLFGAKRVPEFFGSLGKGIKEFKKAMREEEQSTATTTSSTSASSEETEETEGEKGGEKRS